MTSLESFRPTEADLRAKARGGPVAGTHTSWVKLTPDRRDRRKPLAKALRRSVVSRRSQRLPFIRRHRRAQSARVLSRFRSTSAAPATRLRREPHRALCREPAHDVRPQRGVGSSRPPQARVCAARADSRGAADAGSTEERSRALQRLGDVSLFVAGFFAQSFARRLVDIDYHIAMAAGLRLVADSCARGTPRRALAGVFGELAQKSSGSSTRSTDVSVDFISQPLATCCVSTRSGSRPQPARARYPAPARRRARAGACRSCSELTRRMWSATTGPARAAL